MLVQIKSRLENKIILSGEYTGIREAIEKNKNLEGADLKGFNLQGLVASGNDLSKADFQGSNLTGSVMMGTNLVGATFRGACLKNVDFTGANLYAADLREADLEGVNIFGANLFGANLFKAKNIKLPIICIYGTRHTLLYSDGIVDIGCLKYPVKEWIEKHQNLGKDNKYLAEQVNEYVFYLKIIDEMTKDIKC
jgi:hypothetical protein